MLEQAKARELDKQVSQRIMAAIKRVTWRDERDPLVADLADELDAIFAEEMAAALEAGRAEERERVVAWLRENAPSMGATSSTSIATYIESGEHVANERPNGR